MIARSTTNSVVSTGMLIVSVLLPTSSATAKAQSLNELPVPLRGVSIDQQLGGYVPVDLAFRDESGDPIKLGDCLQGKPTILVLVYYRCPRLCNQVLNGLLDSLANLAAFDVGKEFNIVAISFDPRETAELAAAKKRAYVESYGRSGAARGWHFLIGEQEAIDRLTDAVGFRYAYDPATNQFAHASGIMVLTPTGKIARYFYGIDYPPTDLRLGLVEAAGNKIGSAVDQILLYCFHYDPMTGKYGLAVLKIMRLMAAATLVGIGILLLRLRRTKFKSRYSNSEAHPNSRNTLAV